MSVVAPPATSRPLTFAFPTPDGRWHVRRGTAHLVAGRLRGVDVPGVGARSGPGDDGGLSAVFFVVYGMRDGCGSRVGTVVRWEVENGQVTRTDEAAADVELIE